MDHFKLLTKGVNFATNANNPDLILENASESNLSKLNYFSEKGFETHLGSKWKNKTFSKLSEDLFSTRKGNRVKVEGDNFPERIKSFSDLKKYPRDLLTRIKKNFERPTLVQAHCIPVLTESRDLIVRAPTGSGKTLAFAIPILRELSYSNESKAIILAPTRELVVQLSEEFKKLAAKSAVREIQHLFKVSFKNFSENLLLKLNKYRVILSTPAKMCKAIKLGMDLSKVTYLVLDEGDKLVFGKFVDQVACIVKALPSSASKCVFSATITPNVRELVKYFLNCPVSICVGQGSSSVVSKQRLMFVGQEEGKILAVRQIFQKGVKPPALIFVQSISRAQELFKELIYDGINVGVIHSLCTNAQRDQTIASFRSGKLWVLITAELAARGMDFKDVNLVINYDFPKTLQDYIHKAGRTGRQGKNGEVITLFTRSDFKYLKKISTAIKASGNECPSWMFKLKKPNKKKLQPTKSSSEVVNQPSSEVVNRISSEECPNEIANQISSEKKSKGKGIKRVKKDSKKTQKRVKMEST